MDSTIPRASDYDDACSQLQQPTLSSFATAFLPPLPNAFASTSSQPYDSSFDSFFLGAPRSPAEAAHDREDAHGRKHVIGDSLLRTNDEHAFQLYQSLLPPCSPSTTDPPFFQAQQRPHHPTDRISPIRPPVPHHSRISSHPSQPPRHLSQPSSDPTLHLSSLATRVPERRLSLANLGSARNFLDPPTRSIGEGNRVAFPTGQLTEDEEEGTPSASPQAVSRMGEVEPQQGPSSRELTREEGTETREDGPTKLSPTLWEDELTVVYQVQVGGQCVARRADNDHVNCTKMLNACTMTRGKRDAFLKVEKARTVVKRGTIHLKGVWLPLNRAIALAELHQSTHLFSPLFAPDIRPLLFRPENLDRTISLVKAARQRQILSSPPPFDLPNGVARKQALTTYFEEVVTTIEERFPGAFLEQREAVTSRSDGGGAELEGEMTRTGPRIPLRRERAVSSSTSEASSRRSSNPFSESIASSTSSTSMSSLSNFKFETMGTSLQDSWESQEVETIDSAFEETSELDDVYRPMPGSPVRRPVLRRDRRHSFPTQPLSYVPIPISSASVNMQTRHSVDNTAFPPYANHPLHPPQLSTFEQKYISPPGGSSFYLPSTLQHQQHQHLLPPSQQQQQQQQRYPQHFAPSRQDALTTAPFPSPDDLYSPSSYSSQSFFSPPTYEPTPTPYSSPPLANTPPPFSSSQYAFPDAPYDYFAHTGYSYLSDFAPTSYAPPPAGRRLASPVERRDFPMGAVLEAPVERGTKAGEKGRERWGSVESEGGAVKKAKGEGAERMRRASVMF